jgi:hypothetical protein
MQNSESIMYSFEEMLCSKCNLKKQAWEFTEVCNVTLCNLCWKACIKKLVEITPNPKPDEQLE